MTSMIGYGEKSAVGRHESWLSLVDDIYAKSRVIALLAAWHQRALRKKDDPVRAVLWSNQYRFTS